MKTILEHLPYNFILLQSKVCPELQTKDGNSILMPF